MTWKNVTRITCDTSYSSVQRLLPLLKRGIRSKGGRVCISRFSAKHEKVHPVVKVQQYGASVILHILPQVIMPIKSTLFEV